MAAILLPAKTKKEIDHHPKAYPFEAKKFGAGHFVGRRWVNTQPEQGNTFKKFARADESQAPYAEGQRRKGPRSGSEVQRQAAVIRDWNQGQGGGALFPAGQGGRGFFPAGQHGRGKHGGALPASFQNLKLPPDVFKQIPGYNTGINPRSSRNVGAWLKPDGTVGVAPGVAGQGLIRKKKSKRGGAWGWTPAAHPGDANWNQFRDNRASLGLGPLTVRF